MSEKAEYEDLLWEDFRTYAWLVHKASEYRELARSTQDTNERGRYLSEAFRYEEEARFLADMQKDDLLFFN